MGDKPNSMRGEQDFILFFDGVCNLCNGFVDYVITRDKKKRFFFSSLQSDSSKIYLSEKYLKPDSSFTTIYLYRYGKVYNRSTAILYTIKELSPALNLAASLLLLIPPKLRDFFYNLISRNRYKLFGKKETCRLPNEEEKMQFL